MVTKIWVKGMLTRFFNNLHKVAISGDYNDLENKLVVNVSALNPTGTIINFFGLETQVPEGYLPCNGAEYLIEDYPVLANHLAEIDTALSRTDYTGSDADHFKVPDLRGEFLRGTGTATRNTGTGSDVGIHQNASLPNITGSIAPHGAGAAATVIAEASGAFYGDPSYSKSKYRSGGSDTSGASSVGLIQFNASRSSSIYQNSAEARPTNTSVLYCIKY